MDGHRSRKEQQQTNKPDNTRNKKMMLLLLVLILIVISMFFLLERRQSSLRETVRNSEATSDSLALRLATVRPYQEVLDYYQEAVGDYKNRVISNKIEQVMSDKKMTHAELYEIRELREAEIDKAAKLTLQKKNHENAPVLMSNYNLIDKDYDEPKHQKLLEFRQDILKLTEVDSSEQPIIVGRSSQSMLLDSIKDATSNGEIDDDEYKAIKSQYNNMKDQIVKRQLLAAIAQQQE